jgi:predicted GTPase
MKNKIKCIILGASGRDFHNFNMLFKNNKQYEVICFTHAQLPVESSIYPKELTGKLYPKGIPIYDEKNLEDLIEKNEIEIVFLSYSDLSHVEVMNLASRSLSRGASFTLISPDLTMLDSKKPVIAVTATRTGVGKSPMTEYISLFYKNKGKKVGIVRHPMPYGDLVKQEVQKFTSLKDLDLHNCTLEEREDYERHILNNVNLYSGIDYSKILKLAEKENDIIIWDGGNNDTPFFYPDLYITIADAKRSNHEISFHPGETNFRSCDIIAINKWENNSKGLNIIKSNAKKCNPNAEVIKMSMDFKMSDSSLIKKNKKVLLIEDGPTITHGHLSHGLAYMIAKKLNCKILDPRKHAKGFYKSIYENYKHIGPVIPAVGYSKSQLNSLKSLIRDCKPDLIISATPTDLRNVKGMKFNVPFVNVTYSMKNNRELNKTLEMLL